MPELYIGFSNVPRYIDTPERVPIRTTIVVNTITVVRVETKGEEGKLEQPRNLDGC